MSLAVSRSLPWSQFGHRTAGDGDGEIGAAAVGHGVVAGGEAVVHGTVDVRVGQATLADLGVGAGSMARQRGDLDLLALPFRSSMDDQCSDAAAEFEHDGARVRGAVVVSFVHCGLPRTRADQDDGVWYPS